MFEAGAALTTAMSAVPWTPVAGAAVRRLADRPQSFRDHVLGVRRRATGHAALLTLEADAVQAGQGPNRQPACIGEHRLCDLVLTFDQARPRYRDAGGDGKAATG